MAGVRSKDHLDDLIRTNKDAKNFRLMTTPLDKTEEEHWKEVIPNREDVYLSGFEVFNDFLVVNERRDALTRVRVRNKDGEWHELDFGEPAYSAWLTSNHEMDR